MADAAIRLEVRADDVHDIRLTALTVPEPAEGQVALRIEKFALSANNATYARLGDSMDYWKFYPTEPGWGVVPVWGVARAEASMTPVVPIGTRISGFFPMASHVVLQPGRADSGGFTEDSPNRRDLPRLYNVYRKVPDMAAGRSDDLALALRQSFWLSFLLADLLSERDYFGADSVVLSSASSKSALGTAYLLSEHGGRPLVIGLTSVARRAAVADTGAYAQVATYEEIAVLPGGTAVFLDFAGRPELTAAVHRHYGTHLRHSALAGFTQGLGADAGGHLPGPEPELFSVPEYIRTRAREVGMPVLGQRFEEALVEFASWCTPWLRVEYVVGADGVADSYRSILDGSRDATTATICSLSG
jgi:hypothetical protein